MPRKYSDIMDELTGRIRRYYGAINVGAHTTLRAFIDLDLLDGFKDNALLEQLFATFKNVVGRIEVIDVVMDVHLGEGRKGENYAKGRTRWKDEKGKIHFFSEYWVQGERGDWYTRNLTPKT